ncbi:hypothetical protein N0V85_001683 [Neurospora sp. IMI 360204]|nr:hypothetical protein N0V85_001683 [Neurospora sp. IMI 360204]
MRSTAWFLFGIITSVASQDTGNHPDWPRWCGKVYKPDYPSFDPGGQTLPPTPDPLAPLLHVQFKPRYSLYLESEKTGEFIINAGISQFHGTHWGNNTSSNVEFHIKTTTDDKVLVGDSVPVNSTGNLFTFNLTDLTPSLSPIEVTLTYSSGPSVKTTLLYLPSKTSGSVTRIDNLNGGLHHLNAASNHTFKPILPYGFYASYDAFLALPNYSEAIQSYADLGLTGMVPLTHYPESASAFAYMNSIGLYYMFDLRENYTNQTWVREQVTAAAKDSDALFSYWSVDEPDGWQAPFSAPVETYNTIAKTDPYHPVSLVLNCQNYFFEKYSQGAADILMADVYPIGITESSANLSNSKWGTPCNSTYGDCGCDNCAGSVLDVSNRFDDLNQYEKWLGLWPKPKMFNPQAFHGEGYWARDPTAEESWVMVLLAINRGVKGVLGWVWPASEILAKAHGRLARVVSSIGEEEDGVVVGLLVEGKGPEKLSTEPEVKGVDAAGWVDKEGRKMLVSVVNTGEEGVEGMVELEVPGGSRVGKVVWDESGGSGDGEWEVKEGKLTKNGLKGMGTALVILELSM